MTLLLFNAPADQVLAEGEQRIPGGQKFEVDEERALELLTQPGLFVRTEPDPSVETVPDGDTAIVEADPASAENVATETDTTREADDGEAHSIEGGTQ